MTQREQIEALKAEVSELREKIASLTEALLQLAVKQPTEVPYVVTPYAPYTPIPYTPPTWPQPLPYSSGPIWVASGDITGD